MPRRCATLWAWARSREASAATVPCDDFCRAGMTLLTPILAVPSTPQWILRMGIDVPLPTTAGEEFLRATFSQGFGIPAGERTSLDLGIAFVPLEVAHSPSP